MERQERIAYARNICMQNMENYAGISNRGQERQIIGTQQERDKKIISRRKNWKCQVRIIGAILLFLFLFGIKSQSFSCPYLEWEMVSECINDDSGSEQIEKLAKRYLEEWE